MSLSKLRPCLARFTRRRLGASPLEAVLPNRRPVAVTTPCLLDRKQWNSSEWRENVWTVPNALSAGRILATPVLGAAIVGGESGLALGLFTAAGVTDLLDGWIARRWPSQSSVLGSVLDPVADKLLVATTYLCLTAAGFIPVPLTLLVLSRDAGLIAMSLRLRWLTLPQPRTLRRFFDPSLPSFQAQPTDASKLNTAIQLFLVGTSLAAPVLGFQDHAALAALWWMVAGSTVGSALSYVFSADTYRILNQVQTAKKPF